MAPSAVPLLELAWLLAPNATESDRTAALGEESGTPAWLPKPTAVFRWPTEPTRPSALASIVGILAIPLAAVP
ncbi:hypothetical protein CVO77_19275 [Sphingopyxis lindanitolerans]|uniref:Uncharacterized protein n=1 Tax=Sphingopyxis lindanitolerans TaxID=2054227 RepID=A0A2S8B3W7_9SPHN|nr:hypothetical protein CVO77_19275 [Sphingopyxis lindanitolerans]